MDVAVRGTDFVLGIIMLLDIGLSSISSSLEFGSASTVSKCGRLPLGMYGFDSSS